jgi:cytochrome P450
LFLLLSHPKQWEALKRDRALLPSALDEVLRFHHPTQSTSTNRRCTEDVELGGKVLKEGDTIRVGLGAANRDPAVFENADVFDIRRKMPVPLLSFGTGPHFCFGSALARFEAQLAFEAVMNRAPDLKLITTQPVKDPARQDRYKEIRVAI